MRFNCGKTFEEKREELIPICDRLRQWHSMFAWLPIRVGNRDCRWLEYIEVRYPKARPKHFGVGIYYGEEIEYRAIQS